jgi:hypothetical protein
MLSRQLKSQFASAIGRFAAAGGASVDRVPPHLSDVQQMVKRLYLEVAEDDFALPFKRQTDSRLALVTGISRKEISQLRRRRHGPAGMPEVEESVVTHVIGRWMAGPPYATPDGIPRRLRYEASGPERGELRALGARVALDIPVRAGARRATTHRQRRLAPRRRRGAAARGAHPAADSEGKLVLLGSDPAELFSTIVHNVRTW